MIGIRDVGGEHVSLPDEHFLLVGGDLVPLLQQVLRPVRQLRVRRDHAKLLLVFEDLLAQLVPAAVEEVHIADLLDPLRRRVVRRVRSTRNVVDEERLLGIERVDPVHIRDRVVGHGGRQVPARIPLERIDLRGVAEQVRLPLARVAADEAVEVFEAHSDGPLVERSVLAGLERGRVVILAEPRGAIAVVLQDPADRRLVARDETVVAGKAGGLLCDHAKAGRVMVASGDERRTRGRTQRR